MLSFGLQKSERNQPRTAEHGCLACVGFEPGPASPRDLPFPLEPIAHACATEWKPPHQTLMASLETPLPSVSQTQGDGGQGHPLPPGSSVCTMPGNHCAIPAPAARKGAAAQTHHASQPSLLARWVPLSTFQVSPGHTRGPRRSRAVGVRGPWPPWMHAHGRFPSRAWPGAGSPTWVMRPHAPTPVFPAEPPKPASPGAQSGDRGRERVRQRGETRARGRQNALA